MKIPKIFNSVNYHICIFSVQTIHSNVKIKNKFENKKIATRLSLFKYSKFRNIDRFAFGHSKF